VFASGSLPAARERPGRIGPSPRAGGRLRGLVEEPLTSIAAVRRRQSCSHDSQHSRCRRCSSSGSGTRTFRRQPFAGRRRERAPSSWRSFQRPGTSSRRSNQSGGGGRRHALPLVGATAAVSRPSRLVRSHASAADLALPSRRSGGGGFRTLGRPYGRQRFSRPRRIRRQPAHGAEPRARGNVRGNEI